MGVMNGGGRVGVGIQATQLSPIVAWWGCGIDIGKSSNPDFQVKQNNV